MSLPDIRELHTVRDMDTWDALRFQEMEEPKKHGRKSATVKRKVLSPMNAAVVGALITVTVTVTVNGTSTSTEAMPCCVQKALRVYKAAQSTRCMILYHAVRLFHVCYCNELPGLQFVQFT